MTKHTAVTETESLETTFDSFNHWHEVTCRSHSLTNCRFDVQAPFRAKLSSRDFGAFVAGATSTSSFASIASRRGLAETAKDGVDDFMALQIVKGTVQFAQAGRKLVGKRGDVFLTTRAGRLRSTSSDDIILRSSWYHELPWSSDWRTRST